MIDTPRLHSGELLDELGGHLGEVGEDLHVSGEQVGLVVGHALLLAEGLHQGVHLGEVVSGEHGEQVVVHLVVQATAEPINESVAGDVAGGGDLQLPEVGALVGGVYGHAVVAKAEDSGEEQTAAGLADQEVREGVDHRHVVHDGQQAKVVQREADLLGRGVLHVLLVEGGTLHGVLAVAAEHEHPRLVRPGEAREEQSGEIEEGLPGDEEAPLGAVSGRLGHLQTPGQDGHGVDIWVTIARLGVGRVQVGHGVVRVVLGLPPLDREALEQVSKHNAHHITIGSGLEDLVVQEIVRQPARLLPEQTQQYSTNHIDKEVVRDHGKENRSGQD
eukprot:Colp12_sorted_trinity150504_noHs@18555